MCASMGNGIRRELGWNGRGEEGVGLCYLRKCCKGPETCSINGVINEATGGG